MKTGFFLKYPSPPSSGTNLPKTTQAWINYYYFLFFFLFWGLTKLINAWSFFLFFFRIFNDKNLIIEMMCTIFATELILLYHFCSAI